MVALQALPGTRSPSCLISSWCKSSGPFEASAITRLYCCWKYSSLFLLLYRSRSEGSRDSSKRTPATISGSWYLFSPSFPHIPARINANKKNISDTISGVLHIIGGSCSSPPKIPQLTDTVELGICIKSSTTENLAEFRFSFTSVQS